MRLVCILLQLAVLIMNRHRSPGRDQLFRYESGNGGVIITEYDGAAADLDIPETIDGKTVTALRSLGKNYGTEHITLTAAVKLINNPFEECFNLQDICFSADHPDYLLSDGVLYSRDMKRLICCPAQLSRKEYSVPDGVEVIGCGAFRNNQTIESVVLPDTVVRIEEDAFRDCHSLEHIRIPSGIRYLGESAFEECALTGVDLSGCRELKTISDRLFAGAWQLEEILLPDTIRQIGDESFKSSGLREIMIPGSVRRIGKEAFVCCQSLRKITTEDLSRYRVDEASFLIDRYENRLMACAIAALPSVCRLPEVEVLDERCLSGSWGIVELEIPASVRLIAPYAAEGCFHLESILILEGHIRKIGDGAFMDDWDLKEITIRAEVEEIGRDVFRGDSPETVSAADERVIEYCRWNGILPGTE